MSILTAVEQNVDVPVGTTPTGAPVQLPLRRHGWPMPLAITGGIGTGKTTLAGRIAAAAGRCGYDTQLVNGRESLSAASVVVAPQGPKLFVLDEAAALFRREPRRCWHVLLREAREENATILVVLHTLHRDAFDGDERLRSAALGGSIVRLRSTDRTEQLHESTVNLARLGPVGHGYAQAPDWDRPVEIHTEVPA